MQRALVNPSSFTLVLRNSPEANWLVKSALSKAIEVETFAGKVHVERDPMAGPSII